MDSVDRKILNLLQRDASLSNVDLAAEVGLSPSTCLRRVQKIYRLGVIDRTVAILNAPKAGYLIKALITVELKVHDEQQTRRFLRKASKVKAVSHFAAFPSTSIASCVCVFQNSIKKVD